MAAARKATGTILQRRRPIVKIRNEEMLVVLRAYLLHPIKWSDILIDVKDKIDELPEDVRALYRDATEKQLRDRVSKKLGTLVRTATEDIPNLEIREVGTRIKQMERRLLDEQPPVLRQPEPEPGPARAPDMRDLAAAALSSSDEDAPGAVNQQEDPAEAPQPVPRRRRRPKKRALGDLIRENHELYNDFIKKKIPRLMRQLGISSSDSE